MQINRPGRKFALRSVRSGLAAAVLAGVLIGATNLLAFVRETTMLNSISGHKEANPCHYSVN
jgi:hypothetical protein